ncbi:hypothetical protein [Methanobrevibacter sp.]|uniref:hypothetical protein n=1 Tax=Methanobrevibacter sp. TaxID=66852 RepID=UPI0026E076E6|nr:hypothetical protein [Methanobrevibacter sp.]MDO5859116.1 hypothetical protein [Methanobrevibacter sp.]
MKGRDKCDLLKEVRQTIADENNIEYISEECTFEGDCTGTCPKCESELDYLTHEILKKQQSGEKVNIKNIFKLDVAKEKVTNLFNSDEIVELDGTPALDDYPNESYEYE